MTELSDRIAGYREGWNDAKAQAADRIEQLEASLAEWKALAIQWAKDNDQPARQENDDVYHGFRGNNEA